MNLTPTIVQKTEKKNKLYYTGDDPYYNQKTKPTSDQQFHNVPTRATTTYNFIQYGIRKKNCNCMIVHGSKFFTFFLVLNETVEYLSPT